MYTIIWTYAGNSVPDSITTENYLDAMRGFFQVFAIRRLVELTDNIICIWYDSTMVGARVYVIGPTNTEKECNSDNPFCDDFEFDLPF